MYDLFCGDLASLLGFCVNICDESISGCDRGKDEQQVLVLICKGSLPSTERILVSLVFSHGHLISLSPLFFFSFLLSYLPALCFLLSFPFPSREWWRQRRAEGVSSSRSQRCCLSERTPSASRCPSRMSRSSCGASNPLPHVR